jgi:RecB family exonuclease
MLVHTDVPIKHFKGLKREEPVAIDSSAMKEFQKCPRAYFFRYILCFIPKDEKIWFAWGRSIHKFYEAAEVNLQKYNNIDIAGALAIQSATNEWGDAKDPPPENKKFAHYNKQNLGKVLKILFNEWKKEKNGGIIQVVHSEMPFAVQLDNGVWSSGRIDQIIKWSGREMIRDFKTTTKKWAWYRRELFPSDQFTRYVYAYRKLSGKPIVSVAADVIICNSEGVKNERDNFNFTNEELSRWEESMLYWDNVIKQCRETDHYPMVERSCNFCDYRDVCTTRGESSQLYMLKTNFTRQVWDNAK